MSGLPSDSNMAAILSVVDAAAGTLSTSAPSAVERVVLDLFDSLRDPLLRYLSSFSLRPSDCEEIVQDTFLALFQHLRRDRPRDNLRGWLFRVAHNLALRRRNQDRREFPSSEASMSAREELVADPGPGPEDQAAATQTRKRLMAVVDALPEQDRRCLFLRAEGLRYREIAEILDMSLSSVSVSLGRSLARISRAAGR